MNINVTSNTSSAEMNAIAQVVQAINDKSIQRPSAKSLVDALLNAETAAKKQRVHYNLGDLTGKWRLYFATGTRKVRQRGGILLGKGFYLPKFIPAYISFQASEEISNRGEISNQIAIAGLKLKLTGLINYLGKKNLLAFDFHQLEISLFNQIVYQGSIGSAKNHEDVCSYFYQQKIAKLPFFAFFLVTEDLIAARGRGGGLAIWVKENVDNEQN